MQRTCFQPRFMCLHWLCSCRGSWVIPHYLILIVPLMKGSQSLTVCCRNHKTSSLQQWVQVHAHVDHTPGRSDTKRSDFFRLAPFVLIWLLDRLRSSSACVWISELTLTVAPVISVYCLCFSIDICNWPVISTAPFCSVLQKMVKRCC